MAADIGVGEDMALIKCSECGREISDKAQSCPGCGAPLLAIVSDQQTKVSYNRDSDTFTGSMPLMVKLAMRAIQNLGWTIDQANEVAGLVTFQTRISWGSWSGISCSLNIEKTSPGKFRVSGTGKQNVRGAQLMAPNFFGEAQSTVRKAIDRMKHLAQA